MIDIQLIRRNPEAVREAMRKLGAQAPIDAIVELDAERRELLQELEALRHERKESSEQIGRMKEGTEREMRIEAMRGVNERIGQLEERLRGLEQRLESALYEVPNLPHESVPVGAGENENRVLREEGQRREFDFQPLPHWELGPQLGILDFERGVK
ncbi:MAG: serine--tRNA ligase, partial [Chloroflexota bacterium]